MGSKALIRLLLVGVAAAVAARASATPPSPALVAKRAEAQRVLNEIAAIDERLSVVTENYDGARYKLGQVRARLDAEKTSLARARVQNARAEQQVARVLVTLYDSSKPSALEAIFGASSISSMLRIADAERAISRSDAHVAEVAKEARARLEQRVRALDADQRTAARSVRQLDQARGQIERGLAQRRHLLASVQTQITKIQARERARQERLAAEARARLAAERAAAARRAEQQRRAAARALAEEKAARAAAAANADATTTTAAATTTTAADPATTSVDPAPAGPTGVASTTAPTTTTPLSAGHPQAAQIALNYIGVPYLWGGATPSGFDCSGLVSYVYAQLGVQLPHFAAAQYGYGAPVSQSELQPGDLVFFDSLDHVGIYIGAGQFVDAPHTGTFVRIESLSDPWYSSHYVGARRI